MVLEISADRRTTGGGLVAHTLLTTPLVKPLITYVDAVTSRSTSTTPHDAHSGARPATKDDASRIDKVNSTDVPHYKMAMEGECGDKSNPL